MGRAEGSRWGCSTALPPHTPPHTPWCLYFVLPSSLPRDQASVCSLIFSTHLCSIRSPFPLTAYVLSLRIAPQNPPSVQYCRTVVIHMCSSCRHCFTCILIQTAISSIKLTKRIKTPKTSSKTSHKTLLGKYAEGSFHPLCSIPNQKRSRKVQVRT